MNRRDFIALVVCIAPWPLASRAQQLGKVHHVAIVHPTLPVSRLVPESAVLLHVFLTKLKQLGYVEGINLIVDRYSGEGRTRAGLKELAEDAVRGGPDVIVTVGNYAAEILHEVTKSVPIVAVVSDPVALGLSASVSHPDGNVTGVVTDAGLNVWEKRFELLREVIPTGTSVAFPSTREGWESLYGEAIRQAARKVGIPLSLTVLNGPPVQEAEYRRAFAAVRDQGVGALAIPDGPGPFNNRQLIVKLVQDLRLPAVYPFREFVDVGGLMSYSPSLPELWGHAAHQVAQILKGTKPADIPFFQGGKFQLVINLV